MLKDEQHESVSDEVDQSGVQPPESFAVRRARVINAVRRSRQRPGTTAAGATVLAKALCQPTRGAVRQCLATDEIKLAKSEVLLPRRTPRAEIADDAGAVPTQKHDPRGLFTAVQTAQIRTSLMGLDG